MSTKRVVYECSQQLYSYHQHWKQPKCLLRGEWINEIQYIDKVKCYSAKKEKE